MSAKGAVLAQLVERVEGVRAGREERVEELKVHSFSENCFQKGEGEGEDGERHVWGFPHTRSDLRRSYKKGEGWEEMASPLCVSVCVCRRREVQ